MPTAKRVLITDLDNTLFDWVGLWYACFSAMFDKIVEISGIDRDALKAQIRTIHQRYGTSEYSFLIEKLPLLAERYRGRSLVDVFAPAIEAYRAARREKLVLYPSVGETLLKIKGSGCCIVGYTESMSFYSNYRVRRLGLDGVFDFIFSPEDHDLLEGLSAEDIRRYPASHYRFKYTDHRHTPKGELKPNKKILLEIIDTVGATPEECVYIGDSLMKDIAMALDANIEHAWAKYGGTQHKPEYVLLREVTHWTDKDVEREKRISDREVVPAVVLEREFSELFRHFRFGGGND